MIHIAICQRHGLDGSCANAVGGRRGKIRHLTNLLAKIRRSIEKEPARAVGANRCRRLRPGRESRQAGANRPAIRTIAIPLREAATRGRSEDFDSHRHVTTILWPRTDPSSSTVRSSTIAATIRSHRGQANCDTLPQNAESNGVPVRLIDLTRHAPGESRMARRPPKSSQSCHEASR